MVRNEKDELLSIRTVISWHVCIDHRKLNKATRKDHCPLPFLDKILDRLAGHSRYCFLDVIRDTLRLWKIQKTKKR